MGIFKRAFAAALSVALAWAPAAQAAGPRNLAPTGTIRAIAVPLPASALPFPALPAALAIAQAPALPAAQASQPGALPQLQQTADPRQVPEAAARAFDGTVSFSASLAPVNSTLPVPTSNGAPALAPSNPDPPAQKEKPWLKRLVESTQSGSKAETWLERGLLLGFPLALAVPILLKAAPVHTLIISAPITLTVSVVLFGSVTIYRLARFLLGRKRPAPRGPPRRMALAAAFGLALGLSLGTAPTIFHGPIVQAVENANSPGNETIRIKGTALRDQVLADLGANPVGRRILTELSFRSNGPHLPPFFIRVERDAVASYNPFLNVIFLSKTEIKNHGWTIEQFLSDPEKQRQYARENQDLFAHELTHAAQARRSPFEPGQFVLTMQYEYEAYLNQHYYIHEQLKANPNAPDIGDYMIALDDIYRYLHSLDSDTAYKRNMHIDSPRYREMMDRLHSEWPAHQIEGYALLARRYAKVPILVEQYRKKAAAVAAAHGLPLPPELQVK